MDTKRNKPLGSTAVWRCFTHPLRPARSTWKGEYVCEECWRRLREIESAGF